MDSQNTGAGLSGVSSAPTLDEQRERLTPLIKQLRRDIDAIIQRVHSPSNQERAQDFIYVNDYETREIQKNVATKLIEAKMWGGKMLESLGSPFPAELADKADAKTAE